jgi:transcriptional regulator with XRE-family HTH domain
MPPKVAVQALDGVQLGQRFQEVREGLGLSRAELARAADYSAEQVRRVEAGTKLPGAQLLATLMDLGGDVCFVLGGNPTPPGNPFDDGLRASMYAQEREALRVEVRAAKRLRAEARGRVLTDQETQLVDAWRELSRDQRRKVADYLRGLRSHVEFDIFPSHQDALPLSGISVRGNNNQVAGRDQVGIRESSVHYAGKLSVAEKRWLHLFSALNPAQQEELEKLMQGKIAGTEGE